MYFIYSQCRRLLRTRRISSEGILWTGLDDEEVIPWSEVQEVLFVRGGAVFRIKARGKQTTVHAWTTTDGDELRESLRQWCPLGFVSKIVKRVTCLAGTFGTPS